MTPVEAPTMIRMLPVFLFLLAFAAPAHAQRYVVDLQVAEPASNQAPPAATEPRWGEAFPAIPPAAPPPRQGAPAPAPAAPGVKTSPPSSAPSATAPQSTSQYRLGPGDRIRAIVFGVEQLSGLFDVEDTGEVSFPLVGSLRAQGVTTAALETAYADALRGRYVLDPKVSIQIDGYRPIYVLGEVGEPGSYPYEKGMTLMAAVATARGFAPRANKRFAMVRRAGSAQEVRVEMTPDALVRPGDTIRIPERFF